MAGADWRAEQAREHTAPAPAPASPADGRGRVERFTWNRNSGAAAVGGWATAAIGQVQTPGRFPLKGN
ncbi:MAG TPA: hypothetical protein PLY77_06405, partial [Plasticicumulans sp.]|nr:hypothetical protein [Plasticicumulans sp.]